ncbi:MAG: type II secretion system F family protein [Acidobacteriota bacterium]|nr:type II secretion system F family protein [Acidobacteriota bacterium]
MPSFIWKGRDQHGEFQEGVLLADSKDAATAVLRQQQIKIASLREKGREIPFLPRLPRRVSQKSLSLFTRQFSVMLDAGLPLVQCLEILGEQQDQPHFGEIINKVRTDVEGGASLAEAMRRQPKAFDDLYVNMVAAGEAGGILDVILQRLSVYLEKAVKLKSQVKSALIYPSTVIVIAIFVVWIILWKVIPVFAQLFSGLGGELPALTRAVVAASNFLARYSFWMILGIFFIGIAIRSYYRTERGRRVIDGLMLRIPTIGDLLRKIAVARFCRTLSTLVSSGVPILDGLEITAKTSGNAIIEDAVMAVRQAVEEGRTLSGPLAETGVFPPMPVQMINVGEQTGALDQMLSKIADFYEDEVDVAVENLMAMLEPLMIVVLGAIIGTIVAAMYLPMYTILGQIS